MSKYCHEQGCRQLISKGRYCDNHRRKAKKQKVRSNYRPDKKFYYTQDWKDLKAFCYQRDKGCCTECGKFVFGKQAQHHHIIPRRERPDLSLDADNVTTVCPPCHGKLDKETGVINTKQRNSNFNWG